MPKMAVARFTRFTRSSALAVCCLLAGGLSAPAVWAHTHLQQSAPAADAAVSAPEHIELRFTEVVIERFAKLTLQFLGSDGRAQPQDVAGVKLSLSADQQGLIATPEQPLAPGRYRVQWRVVSADTHPVKGKFEFTVK